MNRGQAQNKSPSVLIGFMIIMAILEEIEEFTKKGEVGLFLVFEDDEIAEAMDTLKNAGIECRLLRLPYQRAILFPRLTGKSSPNKKRT